MEFFEANGQVDEVRALVEKCHMLAVGGVGGTMRETALTRSQVGGRR